MQKITNDLKFTAGGLLEFMVLKMLSGWTYSVNEIYDGLRSFGFNTPRGSLYPLLSRLQRDGLITSGLEEVDSDGVQKTYDLTPTRKGCILYQ